MGSVNFHISSNQKTPVQARKVDADGKEYLYAVATGGATKETIYMVGWDEYGREALALADNTENYIPGVATETLSSGESGWFQVGGYRSGVTTESLDLDPGDYLGIDGGATVDAGTSWSTAVFAATPDDDDGSAATSHNLMLFGREITATS